MAAISTRSAAPLANSCRRELGDRLARGALAHADQDSAISDRHDVAALQRRQPEVLVRVAPPDLDVGVREVRMELVDGGRQQRLLAPDRPVQRVQRHAAVDPARRVPRIEGVRQRRQKILGDPGRLPNHRQILGAALVRQIRRRETADHELRELPRIEALEERPRFIDKPKADLVDRDLAVQDPFLRFRNVERLRQQVVHLDNVDAAFAHLVDEVEMIALGVVHPQDVVEQERVAVRRRQPRVRQARRADHDLVQRADLGMDSVCGCRLRGRSLLGGAGFGGTVAAGGWFCSRVSRHDEFPRS